MYCLKKEDVLRTLAQAIEQAALEVIALVVGVDIVSEPHVRLAWRGFESNIISSFHLTGSISGTAHVYYTVPRAKRMPRTMLRVESPVEDCDMLDAATEVANMIVGNVKTMIEGRWGPVQIGYPDVELAADSDLQPQGMSMSFRCCGDVFTVSVAFQEDSPRWDN